MKGASKAKLQPYEQALKKFEYKQAFMKALVAQNPEVVVALVEELVERGGLYQALSGKSEAELEIILNFLIWKVGDYRYARVLLEVARIVIDMYSSVFGLSKKIKSKVQELQQVV